MNEKDHYVTEFNRYEKKYLSSEMFVINHSCAKKLRLSHVQVCQTGDAASQDFLLH